METARDSSTSVEKDGTDTSVNGISSLETGSWDDASVKRLVRKIDWRLIPFLALLYLLSFLDRTNIGNARLDTLERDLGMPKTSLQYNNALAICR